MRKGSKEDKNARKVQGVSNVEERLKIRNVVDIVTEKELGGNRTNTRER